MQALRDCVRCTRSVRGGRLPRRTCLCDMRTRGGALPCPVSVSAASVSHGLGPHPVREVLAPSFRVRAWAPIYLSVHYLYNGQRPPCVEAAAGGSGGLCSLRRKQQLRRQRRRRLSAASASVGGGSGGRGGLWLLPLAAVPQALSTGATGTGGCIREGVYITRGCVHH
jgi:hypothetical protein